MFAARAGRPWFVVALLIAAGLATAIARPAPAPAHSPSFARVMRQRLDNQLMAAHLRLLERQVRERRQWLEAEGEEAQRELVRATREHVRRNGLGHGCILGRRDRSLVRGEPLE